MTGILRTPPGSGLEATSGTQGLLPRAELVLEAGGEQGAPLLEALEMRSSLRCSGYMLFLGGAGGGVHPRGGATGFFLGGVEGGIHLGMDDGGVSTQSPAGRSGLQPRVTSGGAALSVCLRFSVPAPRVPHPHRGASFSSGKQLWEHLRLPSGVTRPLNYPRPPPSQVSPHLPPRLASNGLGKSTEKKQAFRIQWS